jgi:hypothetical protein
LEEFLNDISDFPRHDVGNFGLFDQKESETSPLDTQQRRKIASATANFKLNEAINQQDRKCRLLRSISDAFPWTKRSSITT